MSRNVSTVNLNKIDSRTEPSRTEMIEIRIDKPLRTPFLSNHDHGELTITHESSPIGSNAKVLNCDALRKTRAKSVEHHISEKKIERG